LHRQRYLLDVNILVALADEAHRSHTKVTAWFDSSGMDWGVCPFTEAGFVRVVTNPKYPGPFSMEEAIEVLTEIRMYRGYRFWPMSDSLPTLTAPFSERLFGHQQVTDACLLGLAVKDKGVLVTMDKAMRVLAGAQYQQHVLVLE
jgi:uncharacterized protein